MISPDKNGRCPVGYIEFNGMCIPRHLASQSSTFYQSSSSVSPSPPKPKPSPPSPPVPPPQPPVPAPPVPSDKGNWYDDKVLKNIEAAVAVATTAYNIERLRRAYNRRLARLRLEREAELAGRAPPPEGSIEEGVELGDLAEELEPEVMRIGDLDVEPDFDYFQNIVDRNTSSAADESSNNALQSYFKDKFEDPDPNDLRGINRINRLRREAAAKQAELDRIALEREEENAAARAGMDTGKYRFRNPTREIGRLRKQDVSVEMKQFVEEDVNVPVEDEMISPNIMTPEEYDTIAPRPSVPKDTTPEDEAAIEKEIELTDENNAASNMEEGAAEEGAAEEGAAEEGAVQTAVEDSSNVTKMEALQIDREVEDMAGIGGGDPDSVAIETGTTEAEVEIGVEETALIAEETAVGVADASIAASSIAGITAEGIVSDALVMGVAAAPELAAGLIVGGVLYGAYEALDYAVGTKAEKRFMENEAKQGTHVMSERERQLRAKDLRAVKKYYEDQVNYHNFGQDKAAQEQHAKDKAMLDAINKNFDAINKNIYHGEPLYAIIDDEGNYVMASNKDLGTVKSTNTIIKDADDAFAAEQTAHEQFKKDNQAKLDAIAGKKKQEEEAARFDAMTYEEKQKEFNRQESEQNEQTPQRENESVDDE